MNPSDELRELIAHRAISESGLLRITDINADSLRSLLNQTQLEMLVLSGEASDALSGD